MCPKEKHLPSLSDLLDLSTFYLHFKTSSQSMMSSQLSSSSPLSSIYSQIDRSLKRTFIQLFIIRTFTSFLFFFVFSDRSIHSLIFLLPGLVLPLRLLLFSFEFFFLLFFFFCLAFQFLVVFLVIKIVLVPDFVFLILVDQDIKFLNLFPSSKRTNNKKLSQYPFFQHIFYPLSLPLSFSVSLLSLSTAR